MLEVHAGRVNMAVWRIVCEYGLQEPWERRSNRLTEVLFRHLPGEAESTLEGTHTGRSSDQDANILNGKAKKYK
jgi:hypothetical protein